MRLPATRAARDGETQQHIMERDTNDIDAYGVTYIRLESHGTPQTFYDIVSPSTLALSSTGYAAKPTTHHYRPTHRRPVHR